VALLGNAKAFLALGGFAYEATCRVLCVRPRPAFGHGAEVAVSGGRRIVCSYHPSQQNTFTGRLTETMLDAVVQRAWRLASDASGTA
jgi:uracil-DNA glycosylase